MDLGSAFDATKAAGRWLGEKLAAASRQGIDAARRLADVVETKAREMVRDDVRGFIDGASTWIYGSSELYHGVGSGLESAKSTVGGAIDAVKRQFGMEKPDQVVQTCPLIKAQVTPQDGGFLVPTDACPGDAIPVGEGGVAQAFAQAKAATVSSSSACCASQPASVRNRTIVYVNGINTSAEAHCKTLKMIRDMTCGKVVGVLNASEGIPTDAVRTNDARWRIRQEIAGGKASDYAGFTPAVKTMKDVMVLQAASGDPATIFAHSEGGAITSLAAVRAKVMLTKGGMGDALSKLDIVSMGSAAPVWPDGPNYTHYIHVQDIVPNALGLGDDALRPGVGAKVVRFGGRDGQFTSYGKDDKLPWKMWSPGKDFVADHYADSSYLPYISETARGCLGKE